MAKTAKSIETLGLFDFERTHEIFGTCLQGYMNATREQLISVFGEPGDGDGGYKSFYSWGIKVTERDGTTTIATIYDWKYERQVGLTEKVEWNIGGSSYKAVSLAAGILCQTSGLKFESVEAKSAR